MGIENLANPELLADESVAQLLRDVNFIALSFADTSTPLTQPFIEAFTEAYGAEPGPFTNYAYDAANIAMLTMLMTDNNGEAIEAMLPFVSSRYVGTGVQGYLDENGDQAIAFYGLYQVAADAPEFSLVGTYDGSTGELTFEEGAES
jgi:ABC-type branched-subunit amino acid transport system substrate-binding protein